MQRDQGYLLDVLNSAELILEYVAERSLHEFKEDIQLQDSVIRRFMIMGEASQRVSNETRVAHPELPWAEMRDMRNFVIHEYSRVKTQTVWDTIRTTLLR